MEILLDDDLFSIILYESDKTLFWRIKGFLADAKFQKYLEKVNRYLVEYQCTNGINDLRKMRAIPPETQQWIQTVWMGNMVQGGLNKMANIVPKDRVTTGTISADEIDRVMREELAKVGLTVKFFTELPEAFEWFGVIISKTDYEKILQ